MSTPSNIDINHISEILKKSIEYITQLDSGNDSSVYKIDIAGEDSLILKSPISQSELSLAKYTFEAEVYKLLNKKNLKTPKLIYQDDKIMILSLIEGEMMDDQDRLYSNENLFKDFTNDLKNAHTIELKGFGYFEYDQYLQSGEYRGRSQTWVEFLNSAWEKHSHILNDYLDSEKIDAVTRYWHENVEKTDLKQGKLLHGDFSMAHVFVKNEIYTGIIDFGDAFIGDPLIDLAYFKLKEINKSYGQQVFDNLVKYYFDSESDLDKIKLNIYMIFWAIERAVSVNDKIIASKFIDKLKIVLNNL